jgi:predicted acetyltransferase
MKGNDNKFEEFLIESNNNSKGINLKDVIVPSANIIIKNGGILENEVIEDGNIKQRYWIQL